MSIDRRTMRGWFEYLDDPKREMTLSEFMALMVFNQREFARLALVELTELRHASEHVEGMLGAIDLLAAHMALQANLPYAASGEVRAALDARRDALRRIEKSA